MCSSLCAHAEARVFPWRFFSSLSILFIHLFAVYVLRQSCSLNLEHPILVRASGQGVLEFLGLHPVSAGVTEHTTLGTGDSSLTSCVVQTHIEPSSQFPDLGPIFLFSIF